MPNRYVRVTFEYVPRPPEQSDDAVGVFDLLINEAGDVLGHSEAFGRWSEVVSETGKMARYPVTMDERGVIDFGPGFKGESYSSNLRERKIVRGEVCTVWGDAERGEGDGAEWTYRVKAVEAVS